MCPLQPLRRGKYQLNTHTAQRTCSSEPGGAAVNHARRVEANLGRMEPSTLTWCAARLLGRLGAVLPGRPPSSAGGRSVFGRQPGPSVEGEVPLTREGACPLRRPGQPLALGTSARGGPVALPGSGLGTREEPGSGGPGSWEALKAGNGAQKNLAESQLPELGPALPGAPPHAGPTHHVYVQLCCHCCRPCR